MRNKSAAKSAASSPPVPARISRIAFFESVGSLGRRRVRISCSSAASFCSSSGSSAFASAESSGSLSRESSRASSIARWVFW